MTGTSPERAEGRRVAALSRTGMEVPARSVTARPPALIEARLWVEVAGGPVRWKIERTGVEYAVELRADGGEHVSFRKLRADTGLAGEPLRWRAASGRFDAEVAKGSGALRLLGPPRLRAAVVLLDAEFGGRQHAPELSVADLAMGARALVALSQLS